MIKKIMKKTFVVSLLLSVLILLSTGSLAITGLSTDVSDISVTLVNQDPDPVEPGGYFDVRFRFENNGYGSAKNIDVEIMPEYPFSLYQDNAIKSIGSISALQTSDDAAVVKYRIKVDKSAVEGSNKLKLRYRIDNGGWVELDEFTINIRTVDAILDFYEINTDPEIIEPGKSAMLKVNFINLADSFLKDLKIKLDLTGLPFAPIGSTNEKVLKLIGSNEKSSLTFELMAEADADNKVYKIPLKAEYVDNIGTQYSRNHTIGVIVGKEPELTVIIEDTDVYASGSHGEISVKFVNRGVADIKFLNVNLKQSDDFSILPPAEYYVGNIDSDDYESADFKIFVKKTGKTQINVPLTITYRDANNNEYEVNKALPLKLFDAKESKQFGLSNSNGKAGIVIVIVIVVVGLFIYLRIRKKKKNKKK